MATLDGGPARAAAGETLRTAAYGEFAECERVDFEARYWRSCAASQTLVALCAVC